MKRMNIVKGCGREIRLEREEREEEGRKRGDSEEIKV